MTQSVRVTEAEVMAIEAPERTKTWMPISHGLVVKALTTAVESHGIGVMSKSYSLSNNAARMFGTWNLDAGNEERGFALGVRNATDKSLAIGIAAGTNVFVCSNLMFSGDLTLFRKHTGGLTFEELVKLAGDAVLATLSKMKRLTEWHDSLKEIHLTKDQCKILTFDMMQRGVFAPSKFHEYGECVREEFEIKRERSLYLMHGGITRLVRNDSLFRIADTTKKLNLICDDWKKAA